MVKKVPMQQKVITEDNEIWEYSFDVAGKIQWKWFGAMFILKCKSD